jgi:hypothetical protein
MCLFSVGWTRLSFDYSLYWTFLIFLRHSVLRKRNVVIGLRNLDDYARIYCVGILGISFSLIGL